MRLSTKIAYNAIAQIISKLIATLLGLVAVAIIAHILEPQGFGAYTTIMTFVAFFGVMADFGLILVTTRMISQPGVDEAKVLNNLFTLRFFSALIFLGLAPLVVFFFPYSAAIKVGVAITTLSFFFIALSQIFVGLFQNKLRMDKISIAEIVSRVFLVLGIVVVARSGYGLLGVVLVTVASSFVSFIFHFIFARKFIKLKFSFDLSLWREIAHQSWPLTVTIVFNLIYLRADILILSLMKTQTEVGLYGITYKIIDVLAILPFMFAGLVLPIMTKSWLDNNRQFFNRVLQRSFDLMVILAVPLIFGAQFLARDLMVAVAGDEYAKSGEILKILVLAVSIIFLGTMFSHAIVAIDKQKKVIMAYLFTSLTALAGYLIFIPRFSYFGAAWVTIYSEFIIAIFSVFYVWKYTGFLPSSISFFKSLLASGAMVAFLYFFDKISFASIYLDLGLSFLLATLIYFSSLYLLQGISKDDILSLINKKSYE